MTAIQNIDFETFKWVKDEVSVTLRRAEEQMQSYVRTGDKSELFNLVNLFHQVVGSLQMLELKSLSSLMLESEELIEDYSDKSSDIRRASFVVLMDSSLSILNQNLDRIENGLRERPVEIVELVNQIRTVRGLEDVEISSLFSPMIDVFPEIDSTKALKDKVYIKRASALRTHYQMALLAFLKEESSDGVHKMRLVFDKVLEMSTFGTVARLWWVASAYADFLRLNEITNRSVHTRILRRIDDLLRNLAATGESALVSDPGEELIKIMLFYTATAEQRTDRIEEIVAAFALEGYFGDEELAASQEDINQAVRGLIAMSSTVNEPVVRTKQLVTDYFESDTPTDAQLLELAQQLEIILTAARENNVEILARLTQEALNVVRGIRDGVVAADDETGFHLASAIIFIENCVSFPNEFDNFAFETGSLKLSALNALNTSAPLTTEMDGTQLSGRERKELIRVVGTEIEENLKDIESRLELFAVDRSRADELTGIADKVTQVRGALQVLGEQKVGLLLSIAEHEFRAVELQHKEATPELVEALAIAIGTMEEYVKGLQSGRVGMDYILDRSITDLEVAIGKKVLRGDVEALLESASSSLFAWLGDQSNFELFTQLKSSLRDLTVLARKTKLSDVEHLVNEQDRIIDVISQEPAFLNDNIISSLQNNMVSITENVIQLYGTKDTDEELKIDSQLAQRKSPISKTTDGMRIHDAMDLSEIGEEITFENDERSTTIIAKEHAQKGDPLSKVDQAVFDAFLQEAEELVNEAKGYHRACEDDLDDREAIRNLRRVFHTLKGSARMVGLENIGEIAWLNESIFNYVLDTGKPMTLSALTFAKKTLAEIDEHRQKGFRTGEKINVTSWGTEAQQLSTAIVDSPDAETQKRTTPVMTLKDSPFANAEQNEEPSAAEEGHEADEILEEQGPDIEVIDEDDFEEDHTLIEWTVEAEDESSIQSASIVSEPSDAEELIELVTTDQSEIPDDDDDIVEIDVESSLDVDISDVIEIATEDFVEAESVLELDLSDVDPDEELELVIPFELDEDEDRGSDPVSPAIADSEIESDYLSFSVIEDVAMRKVFVEEASASIQDIRDLVAQPDRAYGTDDELSIKLHTLLGNARTLGLSALATAFHEAEELCSVRHRSAEVVSAADRALFTELTDLTDDVLKSEQSDDPYFTVDTEAWQAVSQGFKQAQEVVPERNNDALDLESLNIELELLSDLDSQEPEFEELESQESEALKSANDDEELVDAQSLLQPETDSELEVLSDELEQIEESIAQFKKEQKLERETPVLDLTQQDEDFEIDVAQEADEEDQDELPATTQQPRQSLIPDELTNLLRDEEVSASSEEVQVDTKDVAQPLLDAENVISDSVLAAVGDVGTQLAEAESDDESVDEAIREVFLTEMAQLQGQLDNEVAKLNDLSAAPSAMPIILQHLHTIKGSALVAEATELGSLTHDVESYLETTTIKSSEDVVKIKQT
ncbi:MAG: Hpt domain-containing protein, partial [Pseudomonadota bacterium]